jgi:hypothetical protein
MTAYECRVCSIAFEIGSWTYWDLDGQCLQLVCAGCGTMHRVEQLDDKPDVLFACPGPIHAMVEVTRELAGSRHTTREIPYATNMWQRVEELPTPLEMQREKLFHVRERAVRLDLLTCANCRAIGRLLLELQPLGEGDQCPKCGGEFEMEYFTVVN